MLDKIFLRSCSAWLVTPDTSSPDQIADNDFHYRIIVHPHTSHITQYLELKLSPLRSHEFFLRSKLFKSVRVSSYPHIKKSILYLLMIPSITLALEFLNTFSILTRLNEIFVCKTRLHLGPVIYQYEIEFLFCCDLKQLI